VTKKSGLAEFFSGPCMAIAMVWFTTHFGGGFASGNQLVTYFVQYGWTGIFLAPIAIGLTGIAWYFTIIFFLKNKRPGTYAEWAKIMYGRFYPFLMPIYEFRVVGGGLVACAVAFATAGSTIENISGFPYFWTSVAVAIVMFFTTIYGSDFIRRVAVWTGPIIVIGIVGTYVYALVPALPNLGHILRTRPITPGKTVPQLLWHAFLYTAYQTGGGGVVAYLDVIHTKEEALRAAIIAIILNSGTLMLAAIGITAYYPEVVGQTVPTMAIVKLAGGGMVAQWAVAALIVLGAVTTAVNIVFNNGRRIALALGADTPAKERRSSMIASGLYTIARLLMASKVPLTWPNFSGGYFAANSLRLGM
jgi:uncharacterized membrane protein YkvI